MESVRDEIEKADLVFGHNFAKHDFDAIAALYTEDCEFMPQGRATMKGRSGIAAFFKGAHDSGVETIQLITDEVLPYGDTALERGRYVFYTKTGAEADVGKYIVLWKNEDGSWKLHFDIFNSNKG